MTSKEQIPAAVGTCSIEIAPVTIEAGRDFTLSARVSCAPPCDREGERLFIFDAEGKERGHLVLAAYDGAGANPSGEITLTAPIEAGPHQWQVIAPACDAGTVHFEEALTDLIVTVEPHKIDLVAWDIPKTVVAGERFSVKLGAKCSGQCAPNGWKFQITDESGSPIAEAPLGDTPWPRTKALHYAEVDLPAPAQLGHFRWTVALVDVAEDMPHEVSETHFGLHCTAAPECTVEIEAMDLVSGAPVVGATVRLHPYHARTDATGIARLAVPKGEYTLLVSGAGHFAHRETLAIAGNFKTRIELSEDRELTEADIWS
ncbi:carboxypeptidase-like regulatory domain-containing protein [Pelagibacterium halotolerans]|uniref:carboxypeptidase-like regulatory domain-containing protein n=1 Tax=Pelagibacterium halotolerans TaxID=531813 RepID=UPI00384FFB0A